MYRLGNKSMLELSNPAADEEVHPQLRKYVEHAIQITPVDFSVHDGVRSIEEQREYVRRGVSQTMNSYHLMRATPKGMYGCAVDLVPYINGKLRWEWDPIYQIIAAIHDAEEIHRPMVQGGRLRWGGVWDKYLDELSVFDLPGERANYAARRRALGKRVFSDGPHIQIEF